MPCSDTVLQSEGLACSQMKAALSPGTAAGPLKASTRETDVGKGKVALSGSQGPGKTVAGVSWKEGEPGWKDHLESLILIEQSLERGSDGEEGGRGAVLPCPAVP